MTPAVTKDVFLIQGQDDRLRGSGIVRNSQEGALGRVWLLGLHRHFFPDSAQGHRV